MGGTGTLIDLCRVVERVISDKTDVEIQLQIDAAISQMKLLGVSDAALGITDGVMDESAMDPLVKNGVVMLVKSSYGHDDSEFNMWWTRYNTILTQIMNSDLNGCAS